MTEGAQVALITAVTGIVTLVIKSLFDKIKAIHVLVNSRVERLDIDNANLTRTAGEQSTVMSTQGDLIIELRRQLAAAEAKNTVELKAPLVLQPIKKPRK